VSLTSMRRQALNGLDSSYRLMSLEVCGPEHIEALNSAMPALLVVPTEEDVTTVALRSPEPGHELKAGRSAGFRP
jgi:hypothetical protein